MMSCIIIFVYLAVSVKEEEQRMSFELKSISATGICSYRSGEVVSKGFSNDNGFLQKVPENQVSYSNLAIFLGHPPFRVFEADFIPSFH